MSWRKRRKLPTTIQVHMLDDDRVEVFGRRMNMAQKILLQNTLQQPKRKQKYKIPNALAIPLQKLAMDNKWEYEGIPVLLLQLKDQLRTRTLDPFYTDDKPHFSKLWKELHTHQQDGVAQIIQYYKGKALLADDMGLGKTHQGVAIALYYMMEGRVLIVCPSYLRFHWEHALTEIGGIPPKDVLVIKKTEEKPICLFNIISYDMLPRDKCEVKKNKFSMLICDESHYVKNRKAKRTKAMMNIAKYCKRILFMTGTPALNRPIELFSQMHMIRPAFAKYSTHFAKRYCDGKMTDYGYDDRGHSCDEELHWLLKKVYMVRRLKRDVLNLPKKTRHTVILEINEGLLTDIRDGFAKWKKMNRELMLIQDTAIKNKKNHERKALVSELFRMTALAKVEAMQRWVKDLIEQDKPFLFFGYHMNTLDMMEDACRGTSYIRIDGSTPSEKRQQSVLKFQRGDAKIALLSIMAAGTGITMTAASIVVFGELFWVPGVMIQAEDRVHRLSQKHPVDIYHLLGKDTLDDHIYKNLISKLKTLDALVDKREDRTLEGETTTEFEESIIDI